MERRQFPRYAFVAYTEVTGTEPPHFQIKARTSDLAREGCYVDTITPFGVGTDVLVKIMKNQRTLPAPSFITSIELDRGNARYKAVEKIAIKSEPQQYVGPRYDQPPELLTPLNPGSCRHFCVGTLWLLRFDLQLDLARTFADDHSLLRSCNH